jgi:hypothetical protein
MDPERAESHDKQRMWNHEHPEAETTDPTAPEAPLSPNLLDRGKLDRYTAIDEKLSSLVDSCPTPPPWFAAWRHTTRCRKLFPRYTPEAEPEPEERLAVWKAVRESGLLPEDAGFYLIADQVEFLTELRVGRKMQEIDRQIDALYAAYGFDDWRAEAHRDSEDFLEFKHRCTADWDCLYVEMLMLHGEEQIARIYRADRGRFEETMRSGREFFYPSPTPPKATRKRPPKWLRKFHREVAKSGAIGLLGGGRATSGMSYLQHKDYVEVCLALTPAELIGGSRDGEVVARNFVLDIERLRRLFDEVRGCCWDPFDHAATSYVSHVCVEGSYRGRGIVLRVLSMPAAGDMTPEPVADT